MYTMPVYEFVCVGCAASRDVLVDYEAKKKLELICVHCGGVMRALEVSGFSIISSSAVSNKEHFHPQRTKCCGHTHACRCAVKLTKPNPFQARIDSALGNGPTKGT